MPLGRGLENWNKLGGDPLTMDHSALLVLIGVNLILWGGIMIKIGIERIF